MERQKGMDARQFFLEKYLKSFVEKSIKESSLKIEKEINLKDPKFHINSLRITAFKSSIEEERFFTLEEFKNGTLDCFLSRLEDKLRKHSSNYFFKKSSKVSDFDYAFFHYLTNQNNLKDVWSNLNAKDRYELFTYLIPRSKIKVDDIISILEPEEYSKMFRINYKREETYVAKEAINFFQRIDGIKRHRTLEETAELIEKIYNNVDNRDKNVIVNAIRNHVVFKEEIFKDLNLKEVIDTDKDKETFEEFEELLNAQVKKQETISFVIDLNAKVLENLFKEQSNFVGLQKTIRSIDTSFIINKEYFIFENAKYLPREIINYSDNFRLRISCTREEEYSNAEKEYREKMLKKLVVKYITENLRKINGQDPNQMNVISSEDLKEKYVWLEKEQREKELFQEMDAVSKVSEITRRKKI